MRRVLLQQESALRGLLARREAHHEGRRHLGTGRVRAALQDGPQGGVLFLQRRDQPHAQPGLPQAGPDAHRPLREVHQHRRRLAGDPQARAVRRQVDGQPVHQDRGLVHVLDDLGRRKLPLDRRQRGRQQRRTPRNARARQEDSPEGRLAQDPDDVLRERRRGRRLPAVPRTGHHVPRRVHPHGGPAPRGQGEQGEARQRLRHPGRREDVQVPDAVEAADEGLREHPSRHGPRLQRRPHCALQGPHRRQPLQAAGEHLRDLPRRLGQQQVDDPGGTRR
mmetsp:Transcript_26071/g.77696  ORF Transcript_26071/g.77696 Transcript_26071/m.77696 type:complete len:278 (-) Transcript_26071:983-1816(-)